MRLLVIEDEKRLAGTLADLLHRQGYTADISGDGLSGLDNAASDIYDLVIYRQLSVATIALWMAGILAGAATGYVLIKPTAINRAAAPRSIFRQADYTALPFMMLAFLVKYVLGVMSAISPQTLQQPAMSAFAIVSGGVFAGVFIGKFTRYVGVYFTAQPQETE